MRTLTLLVGAALALALVSLAGPVTASSFCFSTSYGACSGNACVDLDGDGSWGAGECVAVLDTDPCHHQSDCCSSTGGFWCPEYEDS